MKKSVIDDDDLLINLNNDLNSNNLHIVKNENNKIFSNQISSKHIYESSPVEIKATPMMKQHSVNEPSSSRFKSMRQSREKD